jgi:hypothetical protein
MNCDLIKRRGFIAGTFLLAVFVASVAPVSAQKPSSSALANPYREQPLVNAISGLQQRIDNGELTLAFDAKGLGYLPALLRSLGIEVESQLLVFSKTSLQFNHITPSTPRAIYFNDSVAVGFVPNGNVIEVAAIDNRQGTVFYSLKMEEADKPRFVRDSACMQCHGQAPSLHIPGMVVRSVIAAADGAPFIGVGEIDVDHRTPIEDRWGGWFVSGSANGDHHRGNAVAANPADPSALTRLVPQFDASRYATTTSDVVALMALEHQVHLSNLFTRLGWITQDALKDRVIDDQENSGVDAAVEETVSYMLFANEAPLHGKITPASAFVRSFPRRGPRDTRGRSLWDFDLKERMFRYPLSYMIYSAQFDNLPAEARHRIFIRLHEVLTASVPPPSFKHLSPEVRQAIIEIVGDTKQDLPRNW